MHQDDVPVAEAPTEDSDKTEQDGTKEEITTTKTIESSDQNDGEDREGRWQEGEELSLVRVRFPGNARSFPFLIGKRRFGYGQKVLAMSDRGMDVGYINSFPYVTKFTKSMLPIRSISKIATEEDLLKQRENIDIESKAIRVCQDLIEKLKLEMNITHVEVIQFGKKMVFYFNSPARVDFRELVKQLVSNLKMRIELRQISVRDRAAALGSIGPCGLMTCCSSFLKNYGSVSIKMAKNQNLALIPSKLNGVCGQIKCCIKYEDDVYSEKRKLLPKSGSFIEAKNGDKGKVLRLHLIMEHFEMITDEGQIRRYAGTQYIKEAKLPKDWSFPERFNHVVNETKTVIGLEDGVKVLVKEMDSQANIDALKDEDHSYYDDYKDVLVSTEQSEEKKTETEAVEQNDGLTDAERKQIARDEAEDAAALARAQSLSVEDQQTIGDRQNSGRGNRGGSNNNRNKNNTNNKKKTNNRNKNNKNRNNKPSGAPGSKPAQSASGEKSEDGEKKRRPNNRNRNRNRNKNKPNTTPGTTPTKTNDNKPSDAPKSDGGESKKE